MLDRFAVWNIGEERLILKAWIDREAHLSLYGEVDFALDPFPYPGITTSVEGLWMGVPVLTLAGERFGSRQGVGIMTNAGLTEWIACDEADYLERAVKHATDLTRLAALRKGLRERVARSPLFDAPRFARHFEHALRAMWDERDAVRRSVDEISSNEPVNQLPNFVREQLLKFFKAGRHAELEKLAYQYSSKFPQSGFLWKVLGASLELQGKQSIPALREAVAFAPGDAESHFNLGAALAAKDQLAAAVTSYNRAIEINAEYANAYCNLGKTQKGPWTAR
ncbi:MAG: tetratricopeptide repeat protein [Rhodocyclaceae bacterium]|nr:tetratricopeptide repeat protein [Rhodocyclaceae bacterium]